MHLSFSPPRLSLLNTTLLLSEIALAHNVSSAAVSLSEETRNNLADIEIGCEVGGAFSSDTEEGDSTGEEGESAQRRALSHAERRLVLHDA